MKSLTKTTRSIRPAEVDKKWVLIDADGLVLGRIASLIANILRGKTKPYYTPHIDCGDNVVVINAERICFTGRKLEQKVYYRHTGYAGGLKSHTARELLDGRFPERVLEKAVERMIPRGPLGRVQMRNLRIFKGSEHDHCAQKPELLDLGARNRKNKISEVVPSPKALANVRSFAKPTEPVTQLAVPRPKGLLTEASPGWSLQEVDRLRYYLDHSDAALRQDALRQLSEMLPIPAEDERTLSPAGVVRLRSLTRRLFKALLENANSSAAARYAAMALVKTVFPDHYREGSLKVHEDRAFGDLARIVQHHELHYFCTFDTDRWAHANTRIEAYLWSCFPFDLAGRTPCLNPASWIDVEEGLSMKVDGAELIENEFIGVGHLNPGPILGCLGQIRPLPTDAKDIIVHLYNGSKLIYEQVYPHDYIFKGHTVNLAP